MQHIHLVFEIKTALKVIIGEEKTALKDIHNLAVEIASIALDTPRDDAEQFKRR